MSQEKEPKGELARYAFGYTDKKPSGLWWAINVFLFIFVVTNIFSCSIDTTTKDGIKYLEIN